MSALNSRIATGTIRHRRFTPMPREFSHSITYFFLNLAEIPTLFRVPFLFSDRLPSLFRFDRRIYFKGTENRSLDLELRNQVAESLGFRPEGEIFLLTQISSFGIGFNPVSFYFFFDRETGLLDAILSEITNTPWGERHAYVNDCRGQGTGAHRFSFRKEFHVSPFLGMDYDYEWSFLLTNAPKESVHIQMNNFHRSGGDPRDRKHFDATMNLELSPFTGRNVALALLRSPLMVLKTLLLIYGHAAILLARRAPFFSHPKGSLP